MKMFKFQNYFVSTKLFFFLFFILFAGACNTDAARKTEIINAIESASDFNGDMLSEHDKSLIADEYNFEEDYEEEAVEAKDNTNSPVEAPASHNRKLIKTGSLEFETDNPKSSRIEIEKLVKKHHAFISNETNNNYNYKIKQNLSIRIPFENFDAFINDLSGSVEHFDYKNINVKDVTEEYIDIQSRLKAKYKLEESFLVLLKKASKIKDILEIEKELNNVRSDIESMEGRLRYLKDQVSLSTLNIVFYKKLEVAYKAEKSFFAKLWYNFQDGFAGLLQFVLGLVSIWPFIFIIAILLVVFRKWWKKRK